MTDGARKGGEPSWLLPPAYEIVENWPEFGEVPVEDPLLDDPATVAKYGEEIVDPVTVGILVRGDRRVASTMTERQAAAKIMIEHRRMDPQEVAEHIGTLVQKLPEIITPLGWEVLPRTDGTGKRVRPTAMFQKVGTGSRATSNTGGKA